MNKRTTQAGFTLVEIAMVLIVIALIMGGILKAHEMIVNTRLKKIQNSEAGIIAAMNLYYDRYRQFPGDDPDASEHFTIFAGMPEINGDGNGVVGEGDDWDLDESTPFTDGEQETLKFFVHLRAAGFIEGHSSDHARPNHSLNSGEIGIQDGSLGLRKHVLVFGNISGDYVRILDSQNDDGNLSIGTIRAAEVGEDMELADSPSSTINLKDQYNLVWELAGS